MFIRIWLSKLDEHSIEVLIGATKAMVTRGSGIVAALLFNVLLGRLYGPELAGVFFLSFTVISVVSVVSRFGLDAVAMRKIAGSMARHRPSEILDTYSSINLVVLLLASVLTTMLVIVAPWLSQEVFKNPILVSSLQVMAFATYPMTFIILHSEMLRGLKSVVHSQLLQNTFIYIIAAILVIMLSGQGFNSLEKAFVMASLGTALLAVFLWAKSAPKGRYRLKTKMLKEVLLEAPPFLVIQILSVINLWIGLIVLGILSTEAEVGLYGMATRIAVLSTAILLAINVLAAPKFSELATKNDLVAIRALAQTTTCISAAAAFLVFLICVFFPQEIMGLFGKEFENAGAMLVILSIGQLINGAVGPVGYILSMTGNANLQRKSTIWGAIINISLCLVLIPEYAGLGAAIAFSMALGIQNVVGAYYVRKVFGFWTLSF